MSFVETLSVWVQLLGLPIAVLGIWLSMRNSARSQDIQVMLNFVDSFREKWEGGWSDLLDDLEVSSSESTKISAEHEKQLRYLLNWIDWVGMLSKQHILKNEKVILASLAPSLCRAIRISKPLLDSDRKRHGDSYWSGVDFVVERLNEIAPLTSSSG